MSLAELIAGKAPGHVTVAKVATVAVANPSGNTLKGEVSQMSQLSQVLSTRPASPPERFATATLATDATLTAPVARSEAALHAALAEAAAGLPVTLAELIEAFGAEGAADWAEGYTPHCRPEFLRAFAIAVSERLARKRAEAPPPPGPLDGLPLLREDRRFIEARTLHRRDRAALLTEYARRWREAAAAKFVPHRQANAGRRAANAWLREATR